MPAEKKGGRTGADNVSAGWLRIFSLQRCSPDRWAPLDQLSGLFPEQNPVRRLRVYNLARTSGFAIRSACRFSSPNQKPASRNRATPGARAAAALLSTSGGCKAAGLTESEPGPRSLAEYCRT